MRNSEPVQMGFETLSNLVGTSQKNHPVVLEHTYLEPMAQNELNQLKTYPFVYTKDYTVFC